MSSSLEQANPLAQLQGSFALKTIQSELTLYVALGRGDRVKEVSFTTPGNPQELAPSLENLARLMVGLDLKQLGTLPVGTLTTLEREILGHIDQLNWEYRRGHQVQNIGPLLCPCHSVSSEDLGAIIRENPTQTFNELQAKTGVSVTCDSCERICRNFSNHFLATQGLVCAEDIDAMRVYGMTQAELALRVQAHLDTHFLGSTLTSLVGYELELATSQSKELILAHLQSAFETKFSLKERT